MLIDKLKRSVTSSVKPTIKTVIWLMKMMLPVTLLVSILDFMGIILIISNWMQPMFEFMGLSGEAAIVFITSTFASIYAAIGVMAGFGLSFREVTLLATMCLICHNLIIETKIQQKAGSSWVYITFIRLFFGLLSGFLLNLVIPQDLTGTLLMPMAVAKATTWLEVFLLWGETIVPLTGKILLFISLLNILQGILREFKLIDMLMSPLKPFMAIMGLPISTTFLWIVVNTLGLAYGGMTMSQELAKGKIARRDARLLNTSAAMNHSMLEDSLLFIALGISIWWVLFPRLIIAIALTWMEKGYNKIYDMRMAKILQYKK